jgi:hypothetical protein
MDDLTDGKKVAEMITAEDIYELGRRHGTDEERNATLNLLNHHYLLVEGVAEDVLWTVTQILKKGSHRLPRL